VKRKCCYHQPERIERFTAVDAGELHYGVRKLDLVVGHPGDQVILEGEAKNK
jgi:hypothetical protein